MNIFPWLHFNKIVHYTVLWFLNLKWQNVSESVCDPLYGQPQMSDILGHCLKSKYYFCSD